MPTLKELVDETTKIKDDTIECHTNLKNNLNDMGVTTENTDKLKDLIDKVKGIYPYTKGGLWSSAYMPFNSYHSFSVFKRNDDVYLLGTTIKSAYESDFSTLDLYKYDTSTNQYTKVSTTPYKRVIAAHVIEDELICFVNGSPTGIKYNFTTNTWSNLRNTPSISITMLYASSAKLNKEIFICNGSIPNTLYIYNADTGLTEQFTCTVNHGQKISLVDYNGLIYIISLNGAEVFNRNTNTFTQINKPPYEQIQSNMLAVGPFVFKDKLYLIPGYTAINSESKPTNLLIYENDTWTKTNISLPCIITAVFRIITIKDKLCMFGGRNDFNFSEIVDHWKTSIFNMYMLLTEGGI